MSHVASVFSPGRKALVAYLTVGYPNPEVTFEAATVLARAGCDIIELGIPFSDPLADGTTIQKASYQSLRQGITMQACLDVARRLRQRITTPLVFMSYYNPMLSFGLEAFCQASARVGIDGLIVPDLPPEEGGELEVNAGKYKLDLIYLLTPASNKERISLVAEKSQGFIYLVSLTGVTGARQALPTGLEDFVKDVRCITPKPLCVGFGVSNAEQASRIAKVADGVIVGSRLIQLIEEDASLSSLRSMVVGLREALNQYH